MSDKHWPPEMWPTPEQWLDWMLTLDREQQLREAEKAIKARQEAARCFEMNHEGEIASWRSRRVEDA